MKNKIEWSADCGLIRYDTIIMGSKKKINIPASVRLNNIIQNQFNFLMQTECVPRIQDIYLKTRNGRLHEFVSVSRVFLVACAKLPTKMSRKTSKTFVIFTQAEIHLKCILLSFQFLGIWRKRGFNPNKHETKNIRWEGNEFVNIFLLRFDWAVSYCDEKIWCIRIMNSVSRAFEPSYLSNVI